MKKFSLLQKISFVYFVGFLLIVLMNYVPSFHDESGKMFGLFKLDVGDDLLHLGSGLWALLAGLYSVGAVRFYFRTFGTIYFFDGVAGIILGKSYLDLALFNHNYHVTTDWLNRIEVNIPHIIIGGTMMIFGFILCKKFPARFMSK